MVSLDKNPLSCSRLTTDARKATRPQLHQPSLDPLFWDACLSRHSELGKFIGQWMAFLLSVTSNLRALRRQSTSNCSPAVLNRSLRLRVVIGCAVYLDDTVMTLGTSTNQTNRKLWWYSCLVSLDRRASGREVGGHPLVRGPLQKLLSNMARGA